jgi:hypothetical protein
VRCLSGSPGCPKFLRSLCYGLRRGDGNQIRAGGGGGGGGDGEGRLREQTDSRQPFGAHAIQTLGRDVQVARFGLVESGSADPEDLVGIGLAMMISGSGCGRQMRSG